MGVLLETGHLIVREPHFDELAASVTLHMDPDVRRLMYTKAKDVEEVKSWIEFNIKHQEKFGYSVGSVFEKETNAFVGRSGLVHVENNLEHPDVEVDCYFMKPFWRKGYGKELLEGFFELGFNKFNLEKILAVVYAINFPAIELAKCVGMEFIGMKKYIDTDFMWFEKKPG